MAVTDMKYRQARTYKDYERLFERRRGETKVIFRDCLLSKKGDNFEVHYNRASKELMFTVSPDNLVTLHSLAIGITKCYRLAAAIGMYIGSDLSGHRRKLHPVRVSNLEMGSKSVPYAPGFQVLLNRHGTPIEYRNVPEDLSKIITNKAKNTVKDATATLRHVTRVSARLGVFDNIIKESLDSQYRLKCGDIKDVNYKEPVGDDAIRLLRIGLCNCNPPNRSAHVNGVWKQLTDQERMNDLKERAIEAGLRVLREHIYTNMEGSYEHKIVQQRTHRQIP